MVRIENSIKRDLEFETVLNELGEAKAFRDKLCEEIAELLSKLHHSSKLEVGFREAETKIESLEKQMTDSEANAKSLTQKLRDCEKELQNFREAALKVTDSEGEVGEVQSKLRSFADRVATLEKHNSELQKRGFSPFSFVGYSCFYFRRLFFKREGT